MKSFHTVLALASVLFIASACDSEQAPSGARAEAPVPVEVATAERRNVARQVNAVGTLFGSESVSITAKVTEQVSAVYFEGGEQVQRGQVLAELTSAQQLAMLSEARANLRENQLQFDRLTNLGRDIATAAEIDVARARVDASEARLAAIESQVADRRIVAPFTGIIGFRRISVGALLTPGTVIAELDSVQPLKLDFTLPEVFYAEVALGDVVDAHSAAWPDTPFPGVIERIGSRIDPVTRTFEVRVLLPNEVLQLRPGMLMSVSVAAGRQERVVLPESALLQSGDRSTVFVVDDAGRAQRRSITLGRRLPGLIIVEEGVTEDEQVVVKGQMLLRPGAPVNVLASRPTGSYEGQRAP